MVINDVQFSYRFFRGSTTLVIHKRLAKFINKSWVWLDCWSMSFLNCWLNFFIFNMLTHLLANEF